MGEALCRRLLKAGHSKHNVGSPVRYAHVTRIERRTGMSFNRVEPRMNSSLRKETGLFFYRLRLIRGNKGAGEMTACSLQKRVGAKGE